MNLTPDYSQIPLPPSSPIEVRGITHPTRRTAMPKILDYGAIDPQEAIFALLGDYGHVFFNFIVPRTRNIDLVQDKTKIVAKPNAFLLVKNIPDGVYEENAMFNTKQGGWWLQPSIDFKVKVESGKVTLLGFKEDTLEVD